MSKFNLEKALSGAKVITVGGGEVTQLTTLKMSTESKLVGVHEDGLCVWHSSGKFDYKNPEFTDLDLKMLPDMGKGFLYVFKNGRTTIISEKLRYHGEPAMIFDLSKYPVGFGLDE